MSFVVFGKNDFRQMEEEERAEGDCQWRHHLVRDAATESLSTPSNSSILTKQNNGKKIMTSENDGEPINRGG